MYMDRSWFFLELVCPFSTFFPEFSNKLQRVDVYEAERLCNTGYSWRVSLAFKPRNTLNKEIRPSYTEG
jgi:hypothetical protein